MSLQSAIGMFILAAFAAFAVTPGGAQEPDGQLKSVLVENQDQDLRSLIDLDAPDAPEPGSKAAAPVSEQHEQPVRSEVADDGIEEVDAPATIIPGLRPILAPAASSKSSTPAKKKRVTAAKRMSEDRLFDLGISTVASPLGLKVRGVFVDSPAHRAGLKPGDTITGVNATGTSTADELIAELRKTGPSDNVSVAILRRGQKQTLVANMASARQSLASSTPRRSFRRQPIPVRTVSSQPQPQAVASPQPTGAPQPIAAPANVVRQHYPARAGAVPSAQPRVVQFAPNPLTRRQIQPAPAQQRYAPRQPAGGRPLIGDGGRLIGNGRLINSTLRILGM